MNDLHKLARIILVSLGIYVLIQNGVGLVATLPFLFAGDSSIGTLGAWMITYALLVIVCSAVVVCLLVWKADFWLAKVVGTEEPEETQIWWLPFAFRLASVCAGILLLSWAMLALVSIITFYIQMVDLRLVARSMPWRRLVGSLIQLALAIYLLCGAPHFVNWQVRKTLEHCQRWEEPDDAYDEEEQT